MGKINYLRERKEERGKKIRKEKEGKEEERKRGKEKADIMFRRGPIKMRCFTAFCSRRAI